jgi:hypothetical protein
LVRGHALSLWISTPTSLSPRPVVFLFIGALIVLIVSFVVVPVVPVRTFSPLRHHALLVRLSPEFLLGFSEPSSG